MSGITYKEAGVDIALADDFLKNAKPDIEKTFRKGVLTGIGHFGAFFQPDFSIYKEPVLVSSTDGVGTKLKIAQMTGIYDTIGQDLVNHCVNDIMCAGAKPLYFLDYFAAGKLDKEMALGVIRGLSKACSENDTALIGGETAEMPGLYREGDFDLAGTIVGIVDKSRIVVGSRIERGDVMLGMPSAGLHTNGYSLARKICFEIKGFSADTHIKELGTTIGKALLSVHKSYKRQLDAVLNAVDVKGISHITGGGIEGNTYRIIPKGLKMDIDWNSWERPVIFKLLQEWGDAPESDIRKAMNLGIGMIVVLSPQEAEKAAEIIERTGEKAIYLGKIS